MSTCLLPILAWLFTMGLMAEAADVVQVELRPNVVRSIGGITEFDRNQFVTIHEAPDAKDLTADEHRLIRDELDIRYGRNGGLLSWQASRVPAAPEDGDMPSVARINKLKPTPTRGHRAVPTPRESDLRETVLCTHPELLHAMPQNEHAAWGPRTYDGVAEFTAQFLKSYFVAGSRPRYLEVFNEPFVKARKMGTTIDALSEQHNVVARRVRELCPDVLVGGYSAAWVELEVNNFGHWESRQKRFMDLAGEEMDFFSYHIYDGVNVTGTPRSRTGSNSEAIMDLIDTYSHIKFGVAKPILITEYGKIPEGGMAPSAYSAKRTAGMLYTLLGQLTTFMDHPDRLAKVIPFVLGKAEWTYTTKGQAKPGEANPFLLWRREADGSYAETDLFLFYRFLRDVNGDWRASRSSNPDVRVHLLADKERLVLLLMNLDRGQQRVTLSGLEGINAKSVTGRFLYTDGEKPVLGERKLKHMPSRIALRGGAAAMMLIDLDRPINATSAVEEQRVYATECLKDIEARKPCQFDFRGARPGDGTMVLRLSSGRPPGLHKRPTRVLFNGKRLEVPRNWAGGTQEGRKNFFGMIELAVPMEHVESENVVEITYPDTGGKVASVVLQANYERPHLGRNQTP